MVTGVPQEERAQIDAVEHRLAQKYAQLPHDHVAGVVQHVYARFNQSKLRDFVPLLVERRAGEQLALSTVDREAVANLDCAVEDSEIVDVGHMAMGVGARRQALTRWRLALGISRG
jgi:CRISPR/Cas system-associated exonuclease Cas4 (RecB family)